MTVRPVVDGVTPEDLDQDIGDRELMAALVLAAETSPELLEQGIKPNKAGLDLYRVRLFKKQKDGTYRPVWITVDAAGYQRGERNSGENEDEGHQKDVELWPFLYEKAYAVFRLSEYGHRDHEDSRGIQQILRALTGLDHGRG